MPEFTQRDIAYSYDGTFDGFLCCVFESFSRKEKPADIVSMKDAQPGLLLHFGITTDRQKAMRVKKSVPQKMGEETLSFLENAFLTCISGKEMLMLDFMRLGYEEGPKVTDMLANSTVLTLTKAVKQMAHEAQKFMGFVRFSVHGDFLLSKIKPKNFVLPLLASHFAERMPYEKFIIYDEAHNELCAYADGKYAITEVSDAVMPDADEEEQSYRDLWKMFYDTIAIEGRENPKCRMTLMPKRYWGNMTEFQTKPKQKKEGLPHNKMSGKNF